MEFIIITGLSGAGLTRAADVCEDLGYYCVDNLPASLLGRFASLCLATRGRYERAALVMDVRGTDSLEELLDALAELKGLDCQMRVLYVEADDATLLRRYKESRRPHPMGKAGESIQQAIRRERAFLAPLRERADFVIQTDDASLNQLKADICRCVQAEDRRFSVTVMSFGYKKGLPPEADLVLDVRCLPNPFYEPDLRPLTGLDRPVADYVFRGENARMLMDKAMELLEFLLPLYESDRRELTVAIGCTGGRHRSVAIAQALVRELESKGYLAAAVHRELEGVK